jgi:hypothetical protein
MPETFREGKFNNNSTFGVLTGVSREGAEFWFDFGLKKAQAILENIDALRKWVDRQETPHGHNDKF